MADRAQGGLGRLRQWDGSVTIVCNTEPLEIRICVPPLRERVA